jgi:hypothetical protein
MYYDTFIDIIINNIDNMLLIFMHYDTFINIINYIDNVSNIDRYKYNQY